MRVTWPVLGVGIVAMVNPAPTQDGSGPLGHVHTSSKRGSSCPSGFLPNDHDAQWAAVQLKIEMTPDMAHGAFPKGVTGPTRPLAVAEV